jgi:hypothetical protein
MAPEHFRVVSTVASQVPIKSGRVWNKSIRIVNEENHVITTRVTAVRLNIVVYFTHDRFAVGSIRTIAFIDSASRTSTRCATIRRGIDIFYWQDNGYELWVAVVQLIDREPERVRSQTPGFPRIFVASRPADPSIASQRYRPCRKARL